MEIDTAALNLILVYCVHVISALFRCACCLFAIL